jgi:hypothetical protein
MTRMATHISLTFPALAGNARLRVLARSTG